MMIRSDQHARQKQAFYKLAALLALLIAGLGGCGYKTMPVPPEEVLPKPITDLRYELNQTGVTLSWSYPVETIKGDRLTDISSFELYRAVVPIASYCETCPIPFGTAISLPGGAIPHTGPRTATYESTLLRPGRLYFFKVHSKASWWTESRDSNIVSFIWNIPPRAPEDLTAHTADGKVTLSWRPVTQHLDGSAIKEPVRYQVYRSRNNADFAQLGSPRDGLSFIDSEVTNGRAYQYKIRAFTIYEKGKVGSGSTATVTAIPVDQTPPPPPLGVKAVRTAHGVKVFWTSVPAEDLKGYRVYRRLPGEKNPVRVGEVSAPSTLFVDPSPPKAGHWCYSVSSIDKSAPANESLRSSETRVRN